MQSQPTGQKFVLKGTKYVIVVRTPLPCADAAMADASFAPPSPNGDVDMTPSTSAPGSTSADTDSSPTISAAVFACKLGAPYTGRPGAGLRSLVQTLLPQLLPPLIRELGEWTVGLRVAGGRLLHTVLVLAEASATTHLQALIPALCK